MPDGHDHHQQLLPLLALPRRAAHEGKRPRAVERESVIASVEPSERFAQVAGVEIMLRHHQNRVLPLLVLENCNTKSRIY